MTGDSNRMPDIRRAFNSPFWPLVVASESVGQEGVDFHLWAHSIIHWNLPGYPVDFQQREGLDLSGKAQTERRLLDHSQP